MRIRHLIIMLLLLIPKTVGAQAKDKAEADLLVWQVLTAAYEPENWHPELIIHDNQIQETAEEGIWCVKGDSFQVRSLRNDFYVCKEKDDWAVLNDSRFPYETMTNLLLNRIAPNRHQLKITHHQYGGKKPVITLPMQQLYDVFARHMQLFASVTKVDNKEIRGILVIHQQRLDYIHMLELRISTDQLSDSTSILTGDLYSNIPQHNIHSIFNEKER